MSFETPFYDKPENAGPKSADKYKNITNISQLSNHYIEQLNSNEFIIKCNNTFWSIIVFLFGTSCFLTIMICILLLDESKNKNTGGLIFAICFLGILFLVGLFSFLFTPIRHKVFLTENYIQIKVYRILCCFNSDKTYDYININNFQVDINQKKGGSVTNIAYLDIYNKKNILFDHDFESEEAEYFVYVVNGFINKKKNMMVLS